MELTLFNLNENEIKDILFEINKATGCKEIKKGNLIFVFKKRTSCIILNVYMNDKNDENKVLSINVPLNIKNKILNGQVGYHLELK